jgi:predicted nicotinamide N-methyase
MALKACGASVVATDYEANALRFAELNAARNALGSLRTRVLDWRDPPKDMCAPLVVAADVLYERRNAQAIASLLPAIVAPGGRALLADPRRPWRAELIERLQRAGWSAMETQLGAELGPSGKEIEIVLLECRRIHRD